MNYFVLLVKIVSEFEPIYVTNDCFVLEGLVQIRARPKSSRKKTELIQICFWRFLESSIKNFYLKDTYLLVEGSLKPQSSESKSKNGLVFTAVKFYSYKIPKIQKKE